jgi:hypothetical protein
MKNVLANSVKMLIFLSALFCCYAVFKVPVTWLLTILFIFNFSVAGGYVLLGFTSSMVVLSVALFCYVMAIMKGIGAHMPLWPFFVELGILLSVFFIVKKSEDVNSYLMNSLSDELKNLEGENDSLLIHKKQIEIGMDSNREKLVKYEKLHEIHENIKEFGMFSEKMRYVLKNIINIFHSEKMITLYLIKEHKSIKITADKENDMMVAEKDQEGLYLKNFDEWVINNKKSIIISDMHKEIRFKTEEQNNARSLISVPVFSSDEVVGILKITSEKSTAFTQEDLRFLDLVAAMIGKVLEVENYAK